MSHKCPTCDAPVIGKGQKIGSGHGEPIRSPAWFFDRAACIRDAVEALSDEDLTALAGRLADEWRKGPVKRHERLRAALIELLTKARTP